MCCCNGPCKCGCVLVKSEQETKDCSVLPAVVVGTAIGAIFGPAGAIIGGILGGCGAVVSCEDKQNKK